jgi:hypothetical protein
MVAGHFPRRDRGRRRLAGGGEVHRHRAQPQGLQAALEVEELAALGVEGAGDVGRAAHGLRHGELHGARLRRRGARAPGLPHGAGPRRGGRHCAHIRLVRVHDAVDGRGAPPRHAADRPRLCGRRGVGHHGVAGALHREHLDGLRGVVVALGLWRDVRVHLHAEQPLLQLAVGGQRGGGHRAGDAAVHHHVDGVGDLDGHSEVLLDQQHGDLALGRERLQHRLDLLHDDWGQTLGGLVHDEELRVEQERAGDREHLLLAARELGAAIGLALGEPGERLVNALDRPRPPAPGEPQMLVDRERRPHPPSLRHVADPLGGDGIRGQPEDLLARELDAPRGAHEPGHRVAQGRLPHAVAADHGEDAAFEGERHALQRVRAAVVDVEVPDLEDHARRSPM